MTTGAAASTLVVGARQPARSTSRFAAAGWGWIAAIALVLDGRADQRVPARAARASAPATASIVSTVEPVVTVALATAIYGEALGAGQLAGGVAGAAAPSSSCSCGRVRVAGDDAPAHAPAPAPARALAHERCPTATAGPTSPSGTASARSSSSTATTVEIAVAQRQAAGPLLPRASRFPPGRYVLDGEIVAAVASTRSASGSTRRRRGSSGCREETPARVRRLRPAGAATTTCCWSGRIASGAPRWRRSSPDAVELTPMVRTAAEARALAARGRGRDRQGGRRARTCPASATGMVKIKRVRTIDAVVVGWRPGKARGHRRRAHPRALRARRHAARGRPLVAASRPRRSASSSAKLAPYETGERGSGRAVALDRPAATSSGSRCGPELVVEITFDHVSDGRIRHGAKVQRWRDDKAPAACTVDQLEQ